jgi:hypothetical protein
VLSAWLNRIVQIPAFRSVTTPLSVATEHLVGVVVEKVISPSEFEETLGLKLALAVYATVLTL